LAERGFALRVVESGSMLPQIRAGDTVLIKPLTVCRPGRVVVVARGTRLVTHRVVRVGARGVVCRGDNALCVDPVVAPERIIGEVVEVVGRGTLPTEWWRPHAAFVGLFLRRALQLTARAPREFGLLARQLGGGLVPSGALAVAGFEVPGDDANVIVLGVSGVAARESSSLAATPDTSRGVHGLKGERVVVPAGIYSRLPPTERRRVLERLAGRDVEVWAYAMPVAGRVVRVTAKVRRALGRLGLPAGNPGDAWLAPLNGLGPGFIHYFTQAELQREVESAGGTQVVVSARGGGSLLMATALL